MRTFTPSVGKKVDVLLRRTYTRGTVTEITETQRGPWYTVRLTGRDGATVKVRRAALFALSSATKTRTNQ